MRRHSYAARKGRWMRGWAEGGGCERTNEQSIEICYHYELLMYERRIEISFFFRDLNILCAIQMRSEKWWCVISYTHTTCSSYAYICCVRVRVLMWIYVNQRKQEQIYLVTAHHPPDSSPPLSTEMNCHWICLVAFHVFYFQTLKILRRSPAAAAHFHYQFIIFFILIRECVIAIKLSPPSSS